MDIEAIKPDGSEVPGTRTKGWVNILKLAFDDDGKITEQDQFPDTYTVHKIQAAAEAATQVGIALVVAQNLTSGSFGVLLCGIVAASAFAVTRLFRATAPRRRALPFGVTRKRAPVYCSLGHVETFR